MDNHSEKELMSKKIKKLLLVIIYLCFITSVAYTQNISYEKEFNDFSMFKKSLGGSSISNFFDPFAFLSNPSLLPLMDTSINFYIGCQALMPTTNSNKFYPFIDYEELEQNIDNSDYLKEYQGLKSSFGISGPLQFFYKNEFFSAGIFNTTEYIMEYENTGVPPILNFHINWDLMLTAGFAYAFDLSEIDNTFIISIGGRLKYLFRDSYKKKLDGNEFIEITNYSDDSVGVETFKQISDGHSYNHGIGVDIGFTLRYNFFILALSMNNLSLPYGNVLGMVFWGKEYDINDNEITYTEDAKIVPFKLNLSTSFYFEKVGSIGFLRDLYLNIDLTEIFSPEFDIHSLKIGAQITLVEYIKFMMGTDFESFSIGINFDIIYVDLGFSYSINYNTENNKSNTIGVMLLLHI